MFDLPKIEEQILKFWQEKDIFKKTVEKDSPRGSFVFFEGPPTANGKPGIHHVLARAFKDLIPRFKTMQGYKVNRKAGWDTHGLPVELEVEKKLGLSNKKDVEGYGVEGFNKKCKESVWQYKEDWEKMTERIGFWVDMNHPYITYNNDYIESLWWVVKQAHKRGLLYRGHKVIPQCPRCGTALSSHEVAQGYKNVEEESVYVKFRIKNKELKIKNQEIEDNTYILAWTTTPWTLPGNIALAVGEEVEYCLVKQAEEYLIIAKKLLNKLKGDYEVIREIMGKDLVGLEYGPLFPGVIKETDKNFENAFKVYLADFVSTEDGTGVVHTAVMYGVEDYELGEKIGLPKVHSVNLDGTFNELVPQWQGRFVKDVEREIIEDLKKRNILFNTESYKHDYPFCWRCGTPLIYYARDSWFFKMSELRDELIRNNQQINWVPEHIKEGRFGEWLKDVKDWAISRERYWGTPLPIWRCGECDEIKVIGSYGELGIFEKLKNTYYLIRHGEAESNTKGILNSSLKEDHYHLTEKGKESIESLSGILREKQIDKIFYSPFLRTKETAKIISDIIGVQDIEEDVLLREADMGEVNGKSVNDLYALVGNIENQTKNGVPGGETQDRIVQRMREFIDKIERQYKNKKIIVVSHGDPLADLISLFSGREILYVWKNSYPQKGNYYCFDRMFAGGQKYFDPHRPYIDEIKLKCDKCGGEMGRVPEVMDCWFDSGAMPFAQWHYPFENQNKIDQGGAFPADYIAEAIDQTRGWFYTLLAVATLLDKGTPYKNVICLGHILDKDGLKMSKSKGNVVNPWEMIDKYGADALRWHLYTMSQAGEPKRFDEKNLKESSRVFMTLLNVVSFYKMFAGEEKKECLKDDDLKNILDKWINSKLNTLIKEVTDKLEHYDITTAGRRIEEFINELSTWYVRRSRDRFKGDDVSDKEAAFKVLQHIIFNLNRLMAPFVPFITEYINQEMGSKFESVHLGNWPEYKEEWIDQRVLDCMEATRKIVELGLAKRAEAGIKVRQPLNKLKIKNQKLKIKEEYIDLIKDELNVKAVEIVDGGGDMEVELDTEIPVELRKEGILRDLVRAVNSRRKKMGLTIDDKINLFYNCQDDLVARVIEESGDELKKSVIAKQIKKVDEELEKVKVGESEAGVRLEKI